jgi:hypothetical protein
MSVAVLVLAVAGFLAAALRAVIALFAVLQSGVEGFLARDLAEVRGRRGDLTGAADAADVRAAARRRRFTAIGFFTMWLGLLLIPALTPWPAFVYASYCVLWLMPRRRRAPQ